MIDKKNSAPREALYPVAVGFLVMALGESFGMNCGYGLNPARDLIPRIFTAVAGWKSEPFTYVMLLNCSFFNRSWVGGLKSGYPSILFFLNVCLERLRKFSKIAPILA